MIRVLILLLAALGFGQAHRAPNQHEHRDHQPENTHAPIVVALSRMSDTDLIATYIVEALRDLGGSAMLIDVAKKIWERHDKDLRARGDIFYRWHYVMRWSANQLAKDGRITFDPKTRGLWSLAKR